MAIKETKYLHYAYPGYPGTPSGPYGDFAETQLQATSPTLAALLADPDTCGASVTSLTPYGSIYDMGRLVQYETEFIATVVKLEFDPSTGTYGCTFQYTQGVGAALSQRVLTCDMAPPGETAYHVVYEAGNNGAPYCAIPWTQARKQCDTCKGNPIGVFDGVKSETRTDYAGAGPQPLVFRRQYSSMLAAANYVSSGNIAADRYQPIGVGWTATYFQWLDYQSGSGFEDVTAYRPDGRIVKFRQIGGVFSPDDDVSMVLVPVLSGITVVGWQLTLADDTKEIYDAQGRLTTVRDRSGREQTIAYETLGARHPQSVTDAFGHTLGFNYDSSQPFKTLAGITLPDGSAIGFIHSGINNLTTVNYPIASGISSVTYHYELLGSNVQSILTGVTPEDGVRLSTFGYDGSRRGASTEHAGGVNKYTFTYNVFAGTTVVVDPLNTSRTYTSAMVAGTKRMATSPSTSGGSGDPKSNAYDTDGNVIARRDFNDNLTCYAYDTVRNLETARVEGFTPATAVCPVSLATYTPAAGTRERKITTTWHASFRIPTQIVEANRTTSFTHDAKGNVLTRTVTDTSIVPNVVRTWTNTYDTSGRMLTEDGPRTDATDVTTYVYYTCTTGAQCGQLQTVTNALSQVTTYNSYNAHGQPTQITDPNSVVTTLAYDLRLRLTDRCVNGTLPYCLSGELTHMDYWPNGLLKKITNPDSSYLQYTHDAAQRLTQINDALSNRINYTLDNMGNRTVESQYDPSNALTRTRSQVFNSLNQLWKQVAAAGTVNVTTTFGYDTNGNQNAINAPLARNSSQQFDELNRLKQITDPASGVTNFVYDAKDNLASVQDPRTLTTSYTYTGHGDLKTQTSPDTGLTANTYDSGGNLKTSTDARNAVTTYTYDSLNRVLAKAFKIGTTTDQTFTYSYDAGANGKGRLTGASDASHTMSWAYDAQGRATSKTQSIGANARTVGYGYTNGLLSTQTNPSGFVVTYGYTNGRVSIVSINGTTILNNVIYDPFGPARQWTWGNGTLGVRTYDTDGKITQIDSAGFSTLGYDDAFRITSITDAVVPANSWTTLGYDNLDRLNNAVKTGTTIGYTYDADGNRLTQIGSTAATYTNAGTSNRLSSVSGGLTRTYTYNTAGSALTTGATIHTYYNSGRMKTGRLTSTGTNTTYLYNALGQRIRKTGGTPGTVVYVYDEAGHLLGEYGSTGTLVQETIWLGDTPVATIRPKTGGFDILYVHTDHLNQPRKITRPSDNLKRWQFNPNPFGDGTPNENPAALGVFKYHLRFPGQYFDIESNLAYNYFRDYDSAIGRYVESDPIGLAAGVNTFAYVGDNPISKTDPKGLFSSYQHNQITAEAMMLARSSCSSLPQDVALADWVPGSQEPRNSFWHAMRDGTDPTETVQTASSKYNDFVDQQWKSCTCGGLARALHAVQDSFARGHSGFQPWSGGLPSPSHVRTDSYPSELERNGAVNASIGLIRKYNSNCQNSCPK